MLPFLKHTVLSTGRRLGIFQLIAGSRWRQQRLLILCYHGLSLKDEHQWRPLFMSPAFFRRRMEILARTGYQVLPLDQSIRMLSEGTLPRKSVTITFDDGFYDFYQEAFPVLRGFGFPATVYQTTYYSDYPFAIFELVISYVLWRGRTRQLDGAQFGLDGAFDLAIPAERDRAEKAFEELAGVRGLTPAQKDELAERVAASLGVEYEEIRRRRILHLMTPAQLSEIVAGGIDVQLHTHRHRTPLDEGLFVREIRDNRRWIHSKLGTDTAHFCYPSGVYESDFLPWLRAEKVLSATTCEYGMATRDCDPLLLPRLLDFEHVTEADFEGWLAGVSSLLPHRRV